MSGSRDISLNIGKGIYSIRTSLSAEELSRVKALMNEACEPLTKGAKQEEVLMLAGMRLAYALDRVASGYVFSRILGIAGGEKCCIIASVAQETSATITAG